ncbi:hypothetical protein A2861_01730 [Candidatus Roizmanbacteria bacterium RIFCSPHIGHO2_01_FULL_38_15]|nr:MAG: hypothetical protein A2861_01730 [Candidatus Roizmanbacteria bacterium RIFCSPHIGHO2_01_FULL_38_15]OGK35917.1 MAG: hypothetical protein A3F59_03340 [Candidatus Roizmanbacteria bacterium RIFCSPHIGHO2_12_FULL_38_13]
MSKGFDRSKRNAESNRIVKKIKPLNVLLCFFARKIKTARDANEMARPVNGKYPEVIIRKGMTTLRISDIGYISKRFLTVSIDKYYTIISSIIYNQYNEIVN